MSVLFHLFDLEIVFKLIGGSLALYLTIENIWICN